MAKINKLKDQDGQESGEVFFFDQPKKKKKKKKKKTKEGLGAIGYTKNPVVKDTKK